MKFYSEPNMHIFKTIKQGVNKRKVLACKFNENGELETEDKELIEKLKVHFKYEESEIKLKLELVVEPKKEDPQSNVKCNKCAETFENKGLLMAHYRKSHPKKGSR